LRLKIITNAEKSKGFVSEQFSVGVQVTFWSAMFWVVPHFGVLEHRIDIDRNDASPFRMLN
jgi:hypothetical protein